MSEVSLRPDDRRRHLSSASVGYPPQADPAFRVSDVDRGPQDAGRAGHVANISDVDVVDLGVDRDREIVAVEFESPIVTLGSSSTPVRRAPARCQWSPDRMINSPDFWAIPSCGVVQDSPSGPRLSMYRQFRSIGSGSRRPQKGRSFPVDAKWCRGCRALNFRGGDSGAKSPSARWIPQTDKVHNCLLADERYLQYRPARSPRR